jgi:predicted lipid-binding transport protein (Tim44 family)
MKKLLAAFLVTTLLFTPIGNFVFQDHSTTAEAAKYRSGKRSFNNNSNTTNKNSFFQNKKADTTKKSSATTAPKYKPSGLMKGLMLGGLAGLLFGSLFANMGFLGSILGLLINVMAIFILISVIRGIFVYFKEKKKKEDPNPWRR